MQSNLGDNHSYDEQINIFIRVVNQRRNDKNKIYSIHEPEVQCISKCKHHKKYEFCNKVSMVRSLVGHILVVLSFRNEYEVYTIDKSLEQVKRINGKPLKRLAGDRGYRGKKESGCRKYEICDV